MLDEFREYEEYTCDLQDESRIRFDEKTFFKGDQLLGLPRAMKIIARKELQDRGYFDSESADREKIIAEVKNELIRWTGFSDEVQDSWLKNYYLDHLKKLKEGTKTISWDDLRAAKSRQFKNKVFDDSGVISGYNDMKKITFEGTIADAIFEGPLRRYYLVCRKDADKMLNNNGRQMDPSKKKNAEQIDVVFKLIAVYLIQKKYTGNEFNYYNRAELGHWAHKYEISKGDYFKSGEKFFKYELMPLYDSYTVNNNVAKILICPEYLEAGQFKIVEEKDFNGAPEGYTFYSDQGAGKMMAKEKFY